MMTRLPPARPSGPLAAGGVLEGAPGDCDAIDPGLERGGDAEVVHRCANHDDIGLQKLLHHRFGVRGLCRIGGRQRLRGQMRNRVAVEVAIRHFHLVMGPALLLHDGGAEHAADGIGAQCAGIEVQQFHGSDLWQAAAPRRCAA